MNSFTAKLRGLRFSPFLACLFTGVLYALPCYFEKLFFLSYVSLTAFFIILIKNENRKKRFGYFFSFSFGFFFTLYIWLSTLYPFPGFNFTDSQAKIIIILACIGIPLFHALLHSAIMSLTKFLPKSRIVSVIGFGCAWILSEWVFSLGTLGFPWGRAALSQVGFLYSIQSVSLFGSYFIAAVLVCSCMLFAFAVIDKKRTFAFAGLSIITANIVLGAVLYYIPVKTGDKIQTAILQGNASMEEKWSGEKSTNKIWDTYIKMAEEAADNGAQVVIMPESAIPKDFRFIYKSLADVALSKDITIIAGVIMDTEDGKGTYNSVLAIYPDGSVSERYDKRHIVPFGEYIPYREFLESVLPFVGELNLGDFTTIQGDDTVIFKVDGIKNGSMICFDSIFDVLARNSVNDGAELLTVVTNDSWFRDSVGIAQHLNHSVLRAIENRRYIIRAANTGISAYITPKGDIISKTAPLVEDIIYCEVFAIQNRTGLFYVFIIGLKLIKKPWRRKCDADGKIV